MPASPNTANYTIFKGIVSVKLSGETTYRDMGNCSAGSYVSNIEKLEHFSQRTGVRSKDKEIVLEKGGTLSLTFEEITPENMALALLGSSSFNSDGETEIEILSQNTVEAAFKIVGQNEVGNKVRWDFGKVSISPGGDIAFFSDEWAQIELTGEVLLDDAGSFGKLAFIDPEVTF